ncbi:MAG: nucleotide exchange factor GrpE [Putridiphycobacter sp.]|nr:nucleotide exchange factor GrpE [Putridiphycobacter sp.]
MSKKQKDTDLNQEATNEMHAEEAATDVNDALENEEKEVEKEPTIEEKLADINDKYLRLYSDFDNFRKRSIKEKADIISAASSDLMKNLLPILDDFERAIANNEQSDDLEGLKEGFILIYNKTLNALKAKGLEPVEVKGEVFDAEVHEAITNIPAPSDDLKGKIVDVIEKGYNLKGKPLRFAKVVVGQ